jgi:hypothetical protein
MAKEQCHEYARLIMEELDPYNVGYIEVSFVSTMAQFIHLFSCKIDMCCGW